MLRADVSDFVGSAEMMHGELVIRKDAKRKHPNVIKTHSNSFVLVAAMVACALGLLGFFVVCVVELVKAMA